MSFAFARWTAACTSTASKQECTKTTDTLSSNTLRGKCILYTLSNWWSLASGKADGKMLMGYSCTFTEESMCIEQEAKSPGQIQGVGVGGNTQVVKLTVLAHATWISGKGSCIQAGLMSPE